MEIHLLVESFFKVVVKFVLCKNNQEVRTVTEFIRFRVVGVI